MAKEDYDEKYTHPKSRKMMKEEINTFDKGGKKGR